MTSVMEHQMFRLLILTGLVPFVLTIPIKYYLIQQGNTWGGAQAYCLANHIDQAIIKTADDMIQLQTEALKHQFSSTAWIGLWNDVNSWRWSLQNEAMGSWNFWYTGSNPPYPNNYGGHAECTVMLEYGWQDEPCLLDLPFICFDAGLIGDNRYIYYQTALTWYDAQTYCRTYHTDLSSSRNTTENNILLQLLAQVPIHGPYSACAWIGLFREAWKWTDMSSVSNSLWMSGKPDNALWNQNCGAVANSLLVDVQCNTLMPFFCYRFITGQQQIIRLKVKSNQDANTPAVQTEVLGQLIQKLKDSRIENITVKWRKLPGGVALEKI